MRFIQEGSGMSTQNSSQTNSLLGYPDDARLLFVNADYFGMSHAVNEAIIRSLEEGIVGSCSVMIPCPWALHALTWLQEAPDVSFGVHLTSVSEQPAYRWGPITCRTEVPSLVDEAGELHSFGGDCARCGLCGFILSDAMSLTLEQIVLLPNALGKHACECGHPEMRRLPDGAFHCPACGSEVLPILY